MFYLRQSTADQIDILGPFIDEDDGKTAETGLTIANTDIRLSKNGGNMADKNSGGGTHDEAGWYAVTFDATDSDTVGRLRASVHVAGALAVWAEYQVLEEAVYDFLFAPGATPIADIKSEADDALTDIKLDHLVAVADGDDPVNNSIIAKMVSKAATADWSAFTNTTDSLEALRDHVGDGTNLTEAGGDGDHLTESGGTGDQLTAITAKTDNLPTDPADQSLVIAATDAILALLPAALVNGRMDASVDGTGMESGAVDAVWAKAMTELGAVPGVTATVLAALEWVFLLARSKGLQTSTTKTLRNDADDGDIATSAISDADGTFTRGKWS